ncbi:hypothetical protein FS837_012260 [Tulasnella sp. UAMH 9824]|nr:hypothetical protein FS837_012260 [Tulasnella sp. UAMH 9824]
MGPCGTKYRLNYRADDYAGVIKSPLDHVQRQHFDKMTAAPTDQNGTVPLHRLPVEIFVQIIFRGLEHFRARGWSHRTYLGRLVTLCRVCKQWREVIDCTPSLWTTVDILDPPAIRSAAAFRSVNYPLNIIGTPPGPIKFATYLPGRSDEFLNAAMMLSTRWSSIQLVVASSDKALAIMHAPAPLLQSLEVKSTVQTRLHLQGGIVFQGTTSQLRRLSLHGVAIPWDSYILRNLQYLSISGLKEYGPSYEETLGILKGCPGLLEVDFSLKLAAAGETSKKEAPFKMAELSFMSLYLSHHWTLDLLETIQLPSIRSVSLDLDPNSGSDQLLRHIIKCAHTLFSTDLDGQYNICIVISCVEGLTWTCEPTEANRGGKRFEITTRDRPQSETLEDFFAEAPANIFKPESITIDLDCPFDLDLSTFLTKLDGVDRIRNIIASDCDLQPLFTYMSRATTNDQWGFPKLERLEISNCDYDPLYLLSMIKARYGIEEGGRGNTSEGLCDLPPPLKWVSISRVPVKSDKDIFGSLKDVLGPGCFELIIM